MKTLSTAQRVDILTSLYEGSTLGRAAKHFGTTMKTVVKLLADAGRACEHFHDRALPRDDFVHAIPKYIHSFTYVISGRKCAATELRNDVQEVCPRISLDPETMLLVDRSIRVGSEEYRPQGANHRALNSRSSTWSGTSKYSHRFLIKLERHFHLLAFHAMCHNFVARRGYRVKTPAQRAGLTNKPWIMEDIVVLLKEKESAEATKTYRRRRPFGDEQSRPYFGLNCYPRPFSASCNDNNNNADESGLRR